MVKQITDLEKTLKGKEEKSRKLEKEYKKVWLIYNQMDRYVSCDPLLRILSVSQLSALSMFSGLGLGLGVFTPLSYF